MIQNGNKVTFDVAELMNLIIFNDSNEYGYILFDGIDVNEKDWHEFKDLMKNSNEEL